MYILGSMELFLCVWFLNFWPPIFSGNPENPPQFDKVSETYGQERYCTESLQLNHGCLQKIRATATVTFHFHDGKNCTKKLTAMEHVPFGLDAFLCWKGISTSHVSQASGGWLKLGPTTTL